jgi:hypothetical protein
METDLRKQNKELVRQLVDRFPRGTRYAERIAEHLNRPNYMKRRGSKRAVTPAMVSQTASHGTYNQLIMWKIVVFNRLYRIQNAKLNSSLKKAVEA